MKTKKNISEALFEIINGLHGTRDKEHDVWEKQAKAYVKQLTKNKNVMLDGNRIEIQNGQGTKTLHTITIN